MAFCLKKKVQSLSVCLLYQFSCLHPSDHGPRKFKREYRICNEIGRGGFGVVYRGYRTVDSMPVAIKFIQHKCVGRWTMMEKQMIPTEICLLEDCQCVTGVIRLVDWFATPRGFWIVMERPENCMDLFDVISVYGRLDESTARGVFRQVLATVMGLKRKQSIVHRDIKDENIIVDMDSGRIMLIDFGAAEIFDHLKAQRFQGTRSYCPPEWFKHQIYLPMEATIWSLDCQSLLKLCLSLAPEARIGLDEIHAHPWMLQPNERYSPSRRFHKVLHKRSIKFRRRGSGWRHDIDGETMSEKNDAELSEESENCTTSYRARGQSERPITVPRHILLETAAPASITITRPAYIHPTCGNYFNSKVMMGMDLNRKPSACSSKRSVYDNMGLRISPSRYSCRSSECRSAAASSTISAVTNDPSSEIHETFRLQRQLEDAFFRKPNSILMDDEDYVSCNVSVVAKNNDGTDEMLMSTPNFVHFDDQTIQADGLALTKSESPSSFSGSANNECLDSAKMTDSLILRIIKSLPQSTPPPKPRRSFIIEASDVVELLEQDRAPSVIATEDCSSSSGIASGSGGVSDIEQLVIKAPTAAACAKKKGSDASNLSCFSDISSIYYSATDSSSIVGSVGCSSNGAIKITDADIDEPEGKHQFDENDGNESDYEDDEDQTIREDAATIIVDDDESFFTRPDVTVVARYGFNVGRSRSVIRSVIDDGHKSATRNLPRTTAAARWMSSGIVARLVADYELRQRQLQFNVETADSYINKNSIGVVSDKAKKLLLLKGKSRSARNLRRLRSYMALYQRQETLRSDMAVPNTITNKYGLSHSKTNMGTASSTSLSSNDFAAEAELMASDDSWWSLAENSKKTSLSTPLLTHNFDNQDEL